MVKNFIENKDEQQKIPHLLQNIQYALSGTERM